MASRAITFGTKQMKDGTRWHACGACHYEWPVADRWLWWPVRLAFVRHRPYRQRHFFGRHGVEVGSDALWRRTMQRIISVGRLRIIFGKRGYVRPVVKACPHCGALAWVAPGIEEPTLPTVPRWEMWRIELLWRLKYSRESYAHMHGAFTNAFRRSETLEDAVRVVTGPVTLAEVRQLVRQREDRQATMAAVTGEGDDVRAQVPPPQ